MSLCRKRKGSFCIRLYPEDQFITIRRNSQNGTVSPQQKKKK